MKTNYKFGTVTELLNQIDADDNRVQFHEIFETGNGGVILLAFKKGQKLDTHLAPAEVMVNVLEGEVDFTMLDKTNTIRRGEFILVGANVPHSVEARTDAKVMLVKIKP